jgi:sulfur carrier protein
VKVKVRRFYYGLDKLKPYSLTTHAWSPRIRFFIEVKIKINGEEREIVDGLSIAGLLEHLQIRPARVVVEHNRRIIARDAYGATMLAEGDALEVVHFVGGG